MHFLLTDIRREEECLELLVRPIAVFSGRSGVGESVISAWECEVGFGFEGFFSEFWDVGDSFEDLFQVIINKYE